MRIMVITKGGATIKSKEFTEDDMTIADLQIYVTVAEKAGNKDMIGSFTIPLDGKTDASAVININNIDHVIFVDPLYQEG